MAKKEVTFCNPKHLEEDLSGTTYIVTGANSGVGFETALQLVKQGAHVVMGCRSVEVGNEVAQRFSTLKGSYDVMKCDLADLQSVRDFVDAFLSKYQKLDGLACNTGMMNMENTPEYNNDGFEITMEASFYGHFLLAELLLEKYPQLKNLDAVFRSTCSN
ncbi:SDR family NAD(P)-dependent oxidoreductase [Flammeovirga aprica]|uniref:SDR family NAD(P)-dependent oxidoreductase n=1 Tax=Flammeovirga aprica JL-4 TaxID=694437 RepID=A0A7X9S137_9BACT|nr:SDR family NAD(P)-dependent oxidoreductase [Flammeovirga aprica]NME72381.1 SDR family NAD(P)-dependent oxidoreductase [Flammeovirga aprica JL-4]